MTNYLKAIVILLVIALEGYSQVPDTLCFPRIEIERKQARYDQRAMIIERKDSIITWQKGQEHILNQEIITLNKDKLNLNLIVKEKDNVLSDKEKKIRRLQGFLYAFIGLSVGTTLIAVFK